MSCIHSIPDLPILTLQIILGRASSSPALDVFITLLSLGVKGFKELVTQRKEMYTLLKEELGKVAQKHGERLLETKSNPISIGKLTLWLVEKI